MAYAMTADGLQSFLDFLQDKGLIASSSAGTLKTASQKLLSAMDEDERKDLSQVDAEDAVRRFLNKNPGALSPESAASYQSRLQRALRMLREYNTNPTSFKAQGVKKSATENGGEKRESQPKKTEIKHSTPTYPMPSGSNQLDAVHAAVASSSVSLSFPLRDKFMAQFILPRDLTSKEARKLARYLEVLAVDFEES